MLSAASSLKSVPPNVEGIQSYILPILRTDFDMAELSERTKAVLVAVVAAAISSFLALAGGLFTAAAIVLLTAVLAAFLTATELTLKFGTMGLLVAAMFAFALAQEMVLFRFTALILLLTLFLTLGALRGRAPARRRVAKQARAARAEKKSTTS
jgi:uncharacterized protein YacL